MIAPDVYSGFRSFLWGFLVNHLPAGVYQAGWPWTWLEEDL